MRKEAVFAIVFGIFIGLLIAIGFFRLNNIKNSESNDTKSTKINDATDNNTPIKDPVSISLLTPSDKQVFGENTVKLAGVTGGGNYIIATGGSSDVIIKSSESGSFETEYKINPALNDLTIYSISPDNQSTKKELKVVYSSEAPSVSSDTDTDQNIEEKLEKAQNVPEFFQGIITDITENGVQIKNEDGKIQQISYASDSTSFAKIGKTTTKLSNSDIAIGDYILALGYKNGQDLLQAFRILVTTPSSPLEVKVFAGEVAQKNKADMEISVQNSEKISVEIDNNSKTYSGDVSSPQKSRFANIKEGDYVIGTYISDTKTNTARMIFIADTSED